MSERDLWCAVLQTAWEDASYTGPYGVRVLHGRAARAWFESGGADFAEVCENAGADPRAVRDRYFSEIKGAAA